MKATLEAALIVVCIAAAIRSTWSPCGWSMLSTITPLGERSRHRRYVSTVAWFVVGAMIGGLMLGGAMAMSSWIVGALHIGWIWSSLIGLLGAIACTISDWKLAGFELPIHRRQVNEDWLDRYRQWVYGAGFGWQIGCGFATYITSASLYLMVLLAVLAGDPLLSAAIGTSFGLVRGLAILAGRRIDSPERLKAFHKHFERAGAIFRASAIGVQMVVVGAISFSISVRLGAVVSSALAALILARTSRHPLLGQLTPREVQVAVSAESTVPAGFVPVRRETANAVHESD